MAKDIIEISKRIKQKFNYKKLNEMCKKMQLDQEDKQQIWTEMDSKYYLNKTEEINFHIVNLKLSGHEKDVQELIATRFKKEGLVFTSISELAFFDFDPSHLRAVTNFIMNGHKTGTLGHNKDSDIGQKLYPVKNLRPMRNHPISYYLFGEFSKGRFNILLKEGSIIEKDKKIELIQDNKEKVNHEKRKYGKKENYKVPDHIYHV